MYHSTSDIEKIDHLIEDIKSGKVSRNKNYYTLAKMDAYQRFKRAKLLISIIEDIRNTSAVDGNRIDFQKKQDTIEINLFNPIMKYNRKAIVTDAEFGLIKSRLDNPDIKIE